MNNDFSAKLDNFETVINKRIDCIETNISKKINLAYKAHENSKANEKHTAETGINTSINSVFPENEVVEDIGENVSMPDEHPDEEIFYRNEETVPLRVCSYYKAGQCRHGANGKKLINGSTCRYLHPKKCKLFCKFGRDGCDGLCGSMHPILCRDSTRYGSCTKVDCTLTHLLGTKRQRFRNNNHAYERMFVDNTTNSGVFKRRSYKNASNNLSDKSNRNFRNNDHIYNQNGEFSYNEREFPPLAQSQSDQFHELTAAINQMQRRMEEFIPHPVQSKQNLHFPNNGKERNFNPEDHYSYSNNQPRSDHNAKNYGAFQQRFLP